jgi:hypothetical protein
MQQVVGSNPAGGFKRSDRFNSGLRAGVPELRCDINEIAATRQERGSVTVPRIVKDVAGYRGLVHRQIDLFRNRESSSGVPGTENRR